MMTMWVRETTFRKVFTVWRYTDCCGTPGKWHGQTSFITKLHHLHWAIP